MCFLRSSRLKYIATEHRHVIRIFREFEDEEIILLLDSILAIEKVYESPPHREDVTTKLFQSYLCFLRSRLKYQYIASESFANSMKMKKLYSHWTRFSCLSRGQVHTGGIVAKLRSSIASSLGLVITILSRPSIQLRYVIVHNRS